MNTTTRSQTLQPPGALADLAYRRELGDGRLLRSSTAADTERLAQFYSVVFRDHAEDAPNQRALAWRRDMGAGAGVRARPDAGDMSDAG